MAAWIARCPVLEPGVITTITMLQKELSVLRSLSRLRPKDRSICNASSSNTYDVLGAGWRYICRVRHCISRTRHVSRSRETQSFPCAMDFNEALFIVDMTSMRFADIQNVINILGVAPRSAQQCYRCPHELQKSTPLVNMKVLSNNTSQGCLV